MCFVTGDPVKPGEQRRPTFEIGDTLERLNQSILQDIVRVFMIKYEVADMAVQSFLILSNQEPKALLQRFGGVDQGQDLLVRYG